MSKGNKNYILPLLIIITIFIRMVLFFAFSPWKPEIERNNLLVDDAYWYNVCAKNIAQYKVFSCSETFPLRPDAHLTPGYPLFIAIHYFLFGVKPYLVLFSQIILQGFFILGIFILGKQIKMPLRAMAIAAIIFAVDPVSIIMPNMFLTESLFGIFILYSVIFLLKNIEIFRLRYIFISSFLLSIAIYIKPGARFLIPVFTAIIFIVFYRNSYREKLKYSLIFIAISISIISPWVIRNIALFGHADMSYHLSAHLRNHAINTIIESRNIPKEDAEKEIESRLSLYSVKRGLNAWEAREIELKIYKNIIAENLFCWLKISLRNEVLLYVIPGSSRYVQVFKGIRKAKNKGIMIGESFVESDGVGFIPRIKALLEKKGPALSLFIFIAIIFNLMVLISAFMGAIQIFKLNKRIFYALSLILMAFTLSIGPFLDPRFKFPSFWIIALFSGACIDLLISRRKGSF